MERRDEAGVETAAITGLVSLDGKRVVDVGCGEGRLTTFAAARAASVYAFDPNAASVENARAALTDRQRQNVRFAVHDAEALNLPRERFDIALCGWSLWCIPLEGVVHALRNLHTALVVDGLIVETQPISAQPRVLTKSVELGTLDMREWVETIGAVDERFAATIAAGLYEPTDQRTLTITSTFDEGHDCLQIAGSWQGTSIPPVLARRLQAASDPVDVEQQIRLRLFRRLPERVWSICQARSSSTFAETSSSKPGARSASRAGAAYD